MGDEADMVHLSYDVLILGSGAAGLRAAISAREAGLEVCVVSKGSPGKSSCTSFSAGVMAGSSHAASLNAHREGTLRAGRNINQEELVQVLVEEAPVRLDELKRWGIHADFQKGYLYAKGRPPVQGEAIVACLLEKNRQVGSQFIGNLLVTDLVTQDQVVGISAYSRTSGTWVGMTAKAVVLATGGSAALYLRNDNPKRMLGEGCKLALEAGAVLQDMEFVQFYPLCLAESVLPALVVPPGLADCGRLINQGSEDILEKYGIQERPAGQRARDSLSQALFKEIYRNGQTVFLDLTSLSEEQWHIDPFSASMIPLLRDRCGAMNRPLRVAPAAHHTMGGIRIDRTGATSVAGLFAAGEVTGGLHGANRMGGNALSETLVFGARAGSSAAGWAKGRIVRNPSSVLSQLAERTLKKSAAEPLVTSLRKTLRQVMWEDGGIMRNREELVRAIGAVRGIREEVAGSSHRQEGDEPTGTLELLSAARVGGLILDGALRRQESRGAHFREDFPERDDAQWRGHLQVRVGANGEDVWNFQPIA